MEGWKNKVFSLIKGPGWTPGSPWTGFIDEVPDVNELLDALIIIYYIILFQIVAGQGKKETFLSSGSLLAKCVSIDSLFHSSLRLRIR